MKQGSKDWHEFRAGGIGASEIGAVLGVSPYMTSYDLWKLKTGRASPQPVNKYMSEGIAMEPELRSRVENIKGELLFPRCFIHPKHSFLRASLDGITADGKTAVELKKCGKTVFEKAKLGRPPEIYKLQCQQQMMCSGAEVNDLYMFFDLDTYVHFIIEPDAAIEERIIDVGGKFWECVVNDRWVDDVEVEPVSLALVRMLDDLGVIKDDLETLKSKYDEARKEILDIVGEKSIEADKWKVSFVEKTLWDYRKACVDHGIDMSDYGKTTTQHFIRRLKDEG
jgi:putative phage-type endonuclease